MTGKIFSESANIYQDQAKVLFDYYKKAAEKIVGEEVELEEKIRQAEESGTRAESTKKKSVIVSGVFGGLAAVFTVLAFVLNSGLFLLLAPVCLVVLIVSLVKMIKSKKNIGLYNDQVKAFTDAKNDIRRDYKVTKMGIVYVPVATSVPFEGKSFVVDHTGSTQNTDFSLSVLHQPQEFQKTLSGLEKSIKNVPIVENTENAEQLDTSNYSLSIQNVTMHDYLGTIDRQVRNIGYLLNDNDRVSISLPVIMPESSRDNFINEYTTSDTQDKPVVTVFDTDDYNTKLESFTKLNEMKKEIEKRGNGDNVEYFKKLIKQLGESVQLVSKVKTNSVTKLLDYTNLIFSAVLKSGFNQYSPVLEAEEISRIREASFDFQESVDDYKPFRLKTSSRVKYDLFGNAWVAEDNSRTNMPFGMNQIQEEVLMPVINNLMNETRIERLKIYNGIKDQKLHYLNEWNKDVEDAFRDNRKTGQDLITQITNAYAEYNAAYQTYTSYKATQDSLKKSGNLAEGEVIEQDFAAEQIAGFEAQAQQCTRTSNEFQEYMERLQEDISVKAEQFGHIEYYEASLRDSQSRDIARAISAENLQNLEARRKLLIQINPYYATFAKIPPAPNTEPKLMEDFTLDLQKTSADLLDAITAHEAEQENAQISEGEMPHSEHREPQTEVIEPSPSMTENTVNTETDAAPVQTTRDLIAEPDIAPDNFADKQENTIPPAPEAPADESQQSGNVLNSSFFDSDFGMDDDEGVYNEDDDETGGF